jgi:replicative DNA helicase
LQIEYNVDVQKLFLRMMVTNAELYTRVSNVMNPDNFEKSIKKVATILRDHATKYNVLPDREQILATTGIDIEPLPELDEGHIQWFLDEFEKFTKKQELERAILKSAELLEKGDYGPVEKLIKDAVQISLQRDLGTDYFYDPRTRLMSLKSNNGQVSTGWPSMDQKLYGGFNRGELQIFAGGSGSGKSLFMQNLSVNWVQNGLNGAYITLELSEGLCSMRIDSMMTDTDTRDIFKKLDDVEMKVKVMAKKSGNFRVKYMPAQSNVNDIRAYCKELMVQSKTKLDFLCVDYLDLLMPVSAKVSPSDLFVKDKYVSEELRNLAKELNILFVTASQLNRSAVEEIEFDHSHISGGISKINTADNVFGIFTSRSMRERGQYQLQLMKTRSSSGVGQKIELDFNVQTLRITDSGGTEENNNEYNKPKPVNNILSQIKSTSTLVDQETGEIMEPSDKKIHVDVQGSKLKNLLATLNKNKSS